MELNRIVNWWEYSFNSIKSKKLWWNYIIGNIWEILKSNDLSFLEVLFEYNKKFQWKIDEADALNDRLKEKLIELWTNIVFEENKNEKIDENINSTVVNVDGIILDYNLDENELNLLWKKFWWFIRIHNLKEFINIIPRVNLLNDLVNIYNCDKNYIDYVLNEYSNKSEKEKLLLLNYFNTLYISLNIKNNNEIDLTEIFSHLSSVIDSIKSGIKSDIIFEDWLYSLKKLNYSYFENTQKVYIEDFTIWEESEKRWRKEQNIDFSTRKEPKKRWRKVQDIDFNLFSDLEKLEEFYTTRVPSFRNRNIDFFKAFVIRWYELWLDAKKIKILEKWIKVKDDNFDFEAFYKEENIYIFEGVESSDIVENWFTNKLSDFQIDTFFDLLKEFKRSRRKNTNILNDNLYIDFVNNCSISDFLKLLDLEKNTIFVNNKLNYSILLAYFNRLISLNYYEIKQNWFSDSHLLNLSKIRWLLIWHKWNNKLEWNYEELWKKHVEEFKKLKSNDLILEQKEEIKEELTWLKSIEWFDSNSWYEFIIKSFNEEHYNLFFENLKKFKYSRRTNKEYMNDEFYLKFIKNCDEEKFYKIYEIEKTSINKLMFDIIKAYFLRFTWVTIYPGKAKTVSKKINSLRNIILEKTEKEDLEWEYKEAYDSFFERFIQVKNTSIDEKFKERKFIDPEDASWQNSSVVAHRWRITKWNDRPWTFKNRAHTIIYSSDKKEKISIEMLFNSQFTNFIRNRDFSNSPWLLKLIEDYNNNNYLFEVFKKWFDSKWDKLVFDFIACDDNFAIRTDEYIINLLEIIVNEWWKDNIINNFESLILKFSDRVLEYIKNIWINSEKINDELTDRHESFKNNEKKLIEDYNNSIKSLEKAKSIELAKKEVAIFFENLESYNLNEEIKVIINKKLDIIENDLILFSALYYFVTKDLNNFYNLYEFDLNNLENRSNSFLLAMFYSSYITKDIKKIINLKNICDKKEINYKYISWKVDSTITSSLFWIFVDNLIESRTASDLAQKIPVDSLTDIKFIKKYINRQFELSWTTEILRALEVHKNILDIEYISEVLNKLPKTFSVRNYILNF